MLLCVIFIVLSCGQDFVPRETKLKLPLFSPTSVWNTRVDNLSAIPYSTEQIEVAYSVLLGATIGTDSVVPVLPGPIAVQLRVNNAISVPIFAASSATNITLQAYAYNGNPTSSQPFVVPRPVNGVVVPSNPQSIASLGLVSLVTPTTEVDLLQTTTFISGGVSQGGGFLGVPVATANAASFPLDTSPGYLNSSFGATWSGAALLAGLLLPEDLESGTIRHALAASYPQYRDQNSYTQLPSNSPRPVSSADFFPPCGTGISDGASWRQYALGCGQTLRLKPAGTLLDSSGVAIDERQFAPVTRLVMQAMRTYGVIPVRVGTAFSILTESTQTGFLNVTQGQLNVLLGRNATNGVSAWFQVLTQISQDLANIPLGYLTNPPLAWGFQRNNVQLRLNYTNWEVVRGAIGVEPIGEGFFGNYNYFGSIDAVLVILACTVFLPIAILVGCILVR